MRRGSGVCALRGVEGFAGAMATAEWPTMEANETGRTGLMLSLLGAGGLLALAFFEPG